MQEHVWCYHLIKGLRDCSLLNHDKRFCHFPHKFSVLHIHSHCDKKNMQVFSHTASIFLSITCPLPVVDIHSFWCILVADCWLTQGTGMFSSYLHNLCNILHFCSLLISLWLVCVFMLSFYVNSGYVLSFNDSILTLLLLLIILYSVDCFGALFLSVVQVLCKGWYRYNDPRPRSSTKPVRQWNTQVHTNNGIWLQGLRASGLCIWWWMESPICKFLLISPLTVYQLGTFRFFVPILFGGYTQCLSNLFAILKAWHIFDCRCSWLVRLIGVLIWFLFFILCFFFC